ncbi:MAG: peptide chain release factor N(5)-glutamine methyltransferase [Eubacterium sp.]|jgi:release factor glutamine methyltransferase|nr:peptide chain release factor N(5)-glutamine methyltransferase [Eubacterium sp.]
MTYAEAIRLGEKRLLSSGIAEAAWDARLLFEYARQIDRNFYYLHMNDELSEADWNAYQDALQTRMGHVPLQYITGEQEFMGLSFAVNPHVLIPRQDTEILVEEAQKRIHAGMDALDLCTGSGCIIVSLSKYAPIHAAASDISAQALKTAKENAKRHGVTVDFIESDLFEGITSRYDIIVSNPPYIPTEEIKTLMPEVREFEPFLALDGKEDGLFFYRKIIREANSHLKPDGFLLLEIGCGQGKDVACLMEAEGYKEITIRKDLSGLDRIVIGKGRNYV